MFTVVGVAIVGSLWLGLPIPRALFPAAAVMIAGACMVIIPNILSGDVAGSLNSGKGWLGFAASVGVLMGLIVFISLVQVGGLLECRDSLVTYECGCDKIQGTRWVVWLDAPC